MGRLLIEGNNCPCDEFSGDEFSFDEFSAIPIYYDNKENYQNREYITSSIMISPKNDTTDQIEFVLNQILGEAKVLLSADSVDYNQAAMYPTEFLNSITLASLPPHRLYLKKYASIILLRSLDPTQGMCNGSRLTIIEISSHVIDAEIATGTHRGNRVFIPRIVMIPSETDFPFVLRRKQFLIALHFALPSTKDKDRVWNLLGDFYLLRRLYLVMANYMLLLAEYRILDA